MINLLKATNMEEAFFEGLYNGINSFTDTSFACIGMMVVATMFIFFMEMVSDYKFNEEMKVRYASVKTPVPVVVVPVVVAPAVVAQLRKVQRKEQLARRNWMTELEDQSRHSKITYLNKLSKEGSPEWRPEIDKHFANLKKAEREIKIRIY